MTAIAGHIMLHHKVYQNKLIQIQAPTKNRGFFYAIQVELTSKTKQNKNQMQQVQHTNFTMPNEGTLSPIRYWYALLSKGFTAIANVSDKNKIRPWFKR